MPPFHHCLDLSIRVLIIFKCSSAEAPCANLKHCKPLLLHWANLVMDRMLYASPPAQAPSAATVAIPVLQTDGGHHIEMKEVD
jgi:hypothetical protein